MRKRKGLFFLLLGILMCSCFFTSVFAAKDGGVYDEYGVLSAGEAESLRQQIAGIRQEAEVDVAILVTRDVTSADARTYAAEYMQDHQIGAGSSNNGVILMHQPDGREITVVFRGNIQEKYSVEIQDTILEDCKVYLREDAFFEAYEAFLQDISNSAQRAVSGNSVRFMDIRGESILSSIPGFAGLSFLVSAIPVFIMTLFQKGKMKTKVQQVNANSYVPVNGFKIRQKQDRFLRTVTTKSRKPKEDRSGGGGGGGGSFSARGESFSGSSSKY